MKTTKLLGILGPTAVGKTKIAKIIAENVNGEIVSADSMQIYRELNIGTAKAQPYELNHINQHMVDVINPDESFSSYDYGILASEIIKKLLTQNITPIMVGGTGFYFDAVLYPLNYSNENVQDIRNELIKITEENGNDFLYEKLKEIDPESAQNIHPNNTKRVMRALEIYYSTGQKKSTFKLPSTPKFKNKLYVLNTDRQVLYNRINDRVDNMIKNGLVEEVESLISKYPLNSQSFTAIGYKEIIEHLNNKCNLNQAIENIKQHTRNYAKRQLTYFARFNDAKWIDVNFTNLEETALEILKDFSND